MSKIWTDESNKESVHCVQQSKELREILEHLVESQLELNNWTLMLLIMQNCVQCWPTYYLRFSN